MTDQEHSLRLDLRLDPRRRRRNPLLARVALAATQAAAAAARRRPADPRDRAARAPALRRRRDGAGSSAAGTACSSRAAATWPTRLRRSCPSCRARTCWSSPSRATPRRASAGRRRGVARQRSGRRGDGAAERSPHRRRGPASARARAAPSPRRGRGGDHRRSASARRTPRRATATSRWARRRARGGGALAVKRFVEKPDRARGRGVPGGRPAPLERGHVLLPRPRHARRDPRAPARARRGARPSSIAPPRRARGRGGRAGSSRRCPAVSIDKGVMEHIEPARGRPRRFRLERHRELAERVGARAEGRAGQRGARGHGAGGREEQPRRRSAERGREASG